MLGNRSPRASATLSKMLPWGKQIGLWADRLAAASPYRRIVAVLLRRQANGGDPPVTILFAQHQTQRHLPAHADRAIHRTGRTQRWRLEGSSSERQRRLFRNSGE